MNRIIKYIVKNQLERSIRLLKRLNKGKEILPST